MNQPPRRSATGITGWRKATASDLRTPAESSPFTIQAPISVEDFWTLRCEMSEKLREKIALLSKEQVAEAKRQALEAFREYSTDRGMSFPAEVLIVSGAKSGPA